MTLIDDWPTTTDLTLREVLADRGCAVVRTFGERQDSRSVVLGIEWATGERYVVKHAEDAQAIAWLESARRFHADVRHAAVPTVVHHITTATGVGLVEEWGAGEILSDSYDGAVLPRDHQESAYRRFLRLRADEIADAIGQLIDIHVAVAAAGYVAVDLYDGCVLYDFSSHTLRLIDLDLYRHGPYVLDGDRAYGSSSYQPPEEFRRGATIDERSTVYTLGRMALVYLGCARGSDALPEDFRGTDEQFAVATEATAADPGDRIQTVSALHAAWSALPDS
jgi:serine/threonine protein kinase